MAAPPPPGLNIYEDISQSVINQVVALMVLSSSAVALRITSRVTAKLTLQWDDYLAMLALVFACGTGALTIIACHHGLGKHIWNPAVNLEQIMKILWAYEFFYGAVIPTTKMSLIMFYHRVFPVRPVTIALRFCASLVLGWLVAIYIVVIVQCQPYTYFWEQYVNPAAKGKCVNFYAFYVSNASLSVLTDFMILLIPIPMVMRLRMPLSQRLVVCGIFALGGFVCIAGVLRIHFLTLMFKSEDLTWNISDSFVWSCVEPCIGIVCACLPTLRPLLRRVFGHLFWSTSKRSQTPNNSNSAGFKSSQNGRAFFRLPDGSNRNASTAPEDEVGLTNNVEGAKYDDAKIPMNSISVRRDIEWSEA
ncbi:hypothetical protein VTN96DRAFT_7484 [Rasamsonia emersonii]